MSNVLCLMFYCLMSYVLCLIVCIVIVIVCTCDRQMVMFGILFKFSFYDFQILFFSHVYVQICVLFGFIYMSSCLYL